MYSARKIRALFQISADNPELLHSQLRMFTSQVPLLYLILLTNVLAVAYTHFETAPRILALYGSGLFVLACAVRLCLWVWTRKQKLTTDQVVRRLKDTVALAGILTVLFLIWGAAFFPTEMLTPRGRSSFSCRSP